MKIDYSNIFLIPITSDTTFRQLPWQASMRVYMSMLESAYGSSSLS